MLAAALFLGSSTCTQIPPTTADILRSGFTELRVTARAVIADRQRRDVYLQLSYEMESELQAFDDYTAAFMPEYRAAFTDYAVEARELRERGEAFRQRQRAMQDRFVELHLAMASTTTPPEWQSLSRQEAKIIESLLNAAIGDQR